MLHWVWWCTSAILVLGKLRQEDCEFKTNLDIHGTNPMSKKKEKEKKKSHAISNFVSLNQVQYFFN
jgi:hypothetical protein